MLAALENVFKACLRKRNRFAEKTRLQVVVYTGVIEVENDSDLARLLDFQYPFDQPGFQTETIDVSSEESTALAKCRQLFGETFARAVKTIFY